MAEPCALPGTKNRFLSGKHGQSVMAAPIVFWLRAAVLLVLLAFVPVSPFEAGLGYIFTIKCTSSTEKCLFLKITELHLSNYKEARNYNKYTTKFFSNSLQFLAVSVVHHHKLFMKDF
jgi:hypothetical protein